MSKADASQGSATCGKAGRDQRVFRLGAGLNIGLKRRFKAPHYFSYTTNIIFPPWGLFVGVGKIPRKRLYLAT
jgi:hypothetical protein